MRNRYKKIDEVLLPLLPDNADVQKKLAEKNRHVAGITHYLKKYSGYPVYNNTDIIYYDDAAKGLEAQKEDLKRQQSLSSWSIMPLKMLRAGAEFRIFSRRR